MSATYHRTGLLAARYAAARRRALGPVGATLYVLALSAGGAWTVLGSTTAWEQRKVEGSGAINLYVVEKDIAYASFVRGAAIALYHVGPSGYQLHKIDNRTPPLPGSTNDRGWAFALQPVGAPWEVPA